MKNTLLFTFCILGLLFATSGSCLGQIATQSYLPGSFTPDDLETDDQNNLVATGYAGFNDFIRKYTPNGSLAWSVSPVTNSTVRGREITTDPSGNVFVAGEFLNTLQLPGGPVLTAQNSSEFFLAKFSPAGSLLWMKNISGGTGIDLRSIDCTPTGDLIFVFHATAPLNLGNGVITNTGASVVKLAPNGDAVWAKPMQTSFCILEDVAVGTTGLIHLTGIFRDTLTIGNQMVFSTTANGDPFVAQLNPAGDALWINANIGTAYQLTNASQIEVASSGRIYVAGTYHFGPVQFNGVTLPFCPNENVFTACFTPYGTAEWASLLAAPGSNYISLHAMDIDSLERILLGGKFTGTVTVGPDVLVNPNPGYDVFLSRLDANGGIIEATAGGSGLHNSSFVETVNAVAFGRNSECFVGGTQLASSGAPFSFGGLASPNPGGFLYKFTLSDYNRIAGNVFYDFNTNGIKDTGDVGTPNALIQVNNQYTASGMSGSYTTFTDTGQFVLALASPSPYYTLVTPGHTVHFDTLSTSDTTRHFVLQPLPGMQDLQVNLVSPAIPRPGFGYPLQVHYKNIGTVPVTGQLQVSVDSSLLIGLTIPPATTQTGNLLTLNFTDLAPMHSGVFVINTSVPSTAILGTVLTTQAEISPISGELTPETNITSVRDTIRGSFDPNDKQVSQNHLTPTEVSEGKYLEYTIRFQNTGTDTAFTVRLLDTLDAQLNIPTFEMLASSHNYTWSIRGNSILEWRFDNILLPDSNTNEAASHGFVKYRIKPNTNLPLGSIIRNTAAIYFDFNAPVITNTATTEVALVSGVAGVNKPQLQVYPNPNKGSFMVQLQNMREQNVRAELRNVLGQTVWQQNLVAENGNVQQQIKTSNLSKGIYYLQVNTGKGTAVQKVVIE